MELLDQTTALARDRQEIVHACRRHADPVTPRQIAQETGLHVNRVSLVVRASRRSFRWDEDLKGVVRLVELLPELR